MQFYLRKKRISLVGFSSVSDALASSAISHADLTLVDLGLSDANGDFWEYAGIEAVCELRNRFGKSPKIWIVTGRDKPDALLSCLNNGADGIIFKHTNFKVMTDKIASAIHEPKQRENVA